jgi:hypothetical protein
LTPEVTTHEKSLLDLSDDPPVNTVTTTYLTGPDDVVANPFEPIYPKAIYSVGVNDLVLRGIAFREGSYSDEIGVTPLTTAPTTETSTANLSYNTEVFYPTQTWSPNYYDALISENTQLVVFPAQFKSSEPGAINGTRRIFDQLKLKLYYLPGNWTGAGSSATTKAAGVSAAPVILGASAVESGGDVTFSVNAATDGSAGVQAVWVLYTGVPGSSYHGSWAPLDLSQNSDDPTLWEGTLTLSSGENPDDIRFMVQAVGGAGLTALATNLGAYYRVMPDASQFQTTEISLLSPPASGTYLHESTFDLLLMADGQPLEGKFVTLDIGGQQGLARTDENGLATISLRPVIVPGSYTVQASFRGDPDYLASTATSLFTLQKDSTSITVTPTSAEVVVNHLTPFVAVVYDSFNRPLGGRSVFFVVHNDSGITFVRSVIADYLGNAPLGVLPLPAGDYTVDVYFNGEIPIGNGQNVTLSDNYYESSSQLGLSLTLKIFDFTGFFEPVANPPVFNQFKAGRAVPIKFSLDGDRGMEIFAAGYPRSEEISCAAADTVNNVKDTLNDSTSSLSYDSPAKQYNYVWKTEKSWSGTCRQLTVRFVDGQSYLLNFMFK